MDEKALVKFCRELGCCDACCFRYLAVKNPKVYGNAKKSILKYEDEPSKIVNNDETNGQKSEGKHSEANETHETLEIQEKHLESKDIKMESEVKDSETKDCEENTTKSQEVLIPGTGLAENGESTNGSSPSAKRRRIEVCSSCLGILQEFTWQECFDMVKEQLDKKRYECDTFACALSAPITTILREKAIALKIKEKFNDYLDNAVTPLKEAWKWSFGVQLSLKVNKALDSGAKSPLLVTVTIEYPHEQQELEVLKTLTPSLFANRAQNKRRFVVEFTRRAAEQALVGASVQGFEAAGWGPVPRAGAPGKCVSVICSHAPVYLAGRYIKLSRTLPQTPWLVNGQRMMESSVQDIIFEHLAKAYKMSAEDCEYRLKLMSAGREDVDVRCLGKGRPFAIEILDPRRELSAQELGSVCDQIAAGGLLRVEQLVYVTKDHLALLKKGEESKTKTYEALCIKLTHSKDDIDTEGPPKVTDKDIERLNKYGENIITIEQKTPLRVLHRRPLLIRTRNILELSAAAVPEHPQLFVVKVRTDAGTYVKEWIHGELGRSKPSLGDGFGAKLDILALDVASVHLDWPITSDSQLSQT